MHTLTVYKWTNMEHNKLISYGNQWRYQYAINVYNGEVYLSNNRVEILNEFGIGEQDIDKWTITHTFPYPEPMLLITDKAGNIRYENGSYFEEN